MLRFFENFDLGETVSKRNKMDIFWKFFEIFKILKIRDSSFVALLILRQFIKSIDRSLKTAPVAAIPVNPFRW